MAQLVVLGGVVKVAGSILAKGKIFTASISAVDSLYIPPYISAFHLNCILIVLFTSYIYSIYWLS